MPTRMVPSAAKLDELEEELPVFVELLPEEVPSAAGPQAVKNVMPPSVSAARPETLKKLRLEVFSPPTAFVVASLPICCLPIRRSSFMAEPPLIVAPVPFRTRSRENPTFSPLATKCVKASRTAEKV